MVLINFQISNAINLKLIQNRIVQDRNHLGTILKFWILYLTFNIESHGNQNFEILHNPVVQQPNRNLYKCTMVSIKLEVL